MESEQRGRQRNFVVFKVLPQLLFYQLAFGGRLVSVYCRQQAVVHFHFLVEEKIMATYYLVGLGIAVVLCWVLHWRLYRRYARLLAESRDFGRRFSAFDIRLAELELVVRMYPDLLQYVRVLGEISADGHKLNVWSEAKLLKAERAMESALTSSVRGIAGNGFAQQVWTELFDLVAQAIGDPDDSMVDWRRRSIERIRQVFEPGRLTELRA